MKLTSLLLITSLLSLTGCATTTPEFCDSATWQERGYTHAMKGSEDQSQTASNDCAAKDAPLAYRIGFDFGLKKYCTFKRGIWAGEHGQGPAESCTDTKWDEYQTGYVTGHQIFKVNAELEGISKQLETARSSLWQLESEGSTSSSPVVIRQKAKIDQLKLDREQISRHLMNLRADTNRR